MRITLAILAGVAFFSSSLSAHPGRTDAYGCHNETATHTYHCHSGQFAGRTFPSKEAMLRELGGSSPSSPSKPTTPSAPSTPSTPSTPSLVYNRDDYLPDWADEDGDCMNTRHEVLRAESLVPATLSANGCTVIAGLWKDPYTGLTFTNPSDLDIDHVVPLKEAHDSGAAYWSTTKKRAYANDLSNPQVLIAVDDGTNSSKGDKDPANWMPPDEAYHCEYIRNWVTVKDIYNLSIDSAEQAAIDAILSPLAMAMPTSVDGWRFDQAHPGITSSSSFQIGMERAGTCGYLDEARVSDVVSITGTIAPEPAHIGRVADIFLVDRVNMKFTMRTQAGVFAPWDGRVPDLVPVRSGITLGESMAVEVFSGVLGIAGDHRLFLGYKLDGQLYYSPSPVRIDITQ